VRPRALFPALVCAACLSLAAGCGDGDERLSRSEFIRQGDALCTEARGKTPRAPRTQDLTRLATYFGQVAQVSTGIISRFRELDPPEDLEDTTNRFLDAATARLRDIRDAADAAGRNDRAGVAAALRRQARDAARYRRLAGQIGFRVCGSGG
jgi:hypothetical protein